MAVETKTFFSRCMRFKGVSIDLTIMAGETKGRRITLEQRSDRCSVSVMAGQALTFGGRFMRTSDVLLILSLVMTVQADFCGRFRKHSGIFTGMHAMARLAVTLPDRFVLCLIRNVIMTNQAKPAFNGQDLDSGAVDLVTVVAVAAAHRRVDHFSEQSRITGTMLCVTVNASVPDRIVLMGLNKRGAVYFMTGTAQVIFRHVQQARIICHVGLVAGEAAICYRRMDSVPCKEALFMAVEAELINCSSKELWIFRIVRIMTGITFTPADRFVYRYLVRYILERSMAWQADCWDRLAQQDGRNHAMREMTGFAVFFLDRLMCKPDF
jgi:hypothetical protein